MKRNAILALVLVAAALLLAGGGAALAVTRNQIDCPGGLCTGTKRADTLVGTEGDDEMVGRAGNDLLIGDPARGEGDDLLRGGDGDDAISDPFAGRDVDTVVAGRGDDTINVREGLLSGGADVVDCGPGHDTVVVDANVFDASDTIAANCEVVKTG